MITDEDRVYEVLQRLGGSAISEEIVKILGWEDKGGTRRLGQIMGRLMAWGRVKRVTVRRLYRVTNGGLGDLVDEARGKRYDA
jgi:hypothetical protein